MKAGTKVFHWTIHLAVYVLSLIIAFVLCRTVFGVVLPDGLGTSLTPNGVIRYAVASLVGLFVTLGMVVVGGKTLRWIYSPTQASGSA